MKRVLMLMTVLSLAAMTQAVMVDDFQGYATGNVGDVASPPWTTSESVFYSDIVDDGAGNQYLVFGGTQTAGSGGDYRDNRISTGLSISGGTATLTFDVIANIDAVDNAFGLTHNEGMNWYADYGPYCRLISNGTDGDGLVELSVRDGGGFVDDLAYLNIGQWYTITLEIDTAGGDSGNGGFDLYLDGQLIRSSNDFRFGFSSANPLDTFCLMATGDNNVNGVGIDNVSVVPEPATMALLGFGALALLRKKR